MATGIPRVSSASPDGVNSGLSILRRQPFGNYLEGKIGHRVASHLRLELHKARKSAKLTGARGENFSNMHLRLFPLEYAARGKRDPNGGLPFFVDNIADDLLIVLIAFVPFSHSPLLVALAVACLHFSLWSVYEIGYYENDLAAQNLEKSGKIPVGFERFQEGYSTRSSWIWAVLLGTAGIGFAWWSNSTFFFGMGAIGLFAMGVLWLGVLVSLRALFHWYNHIDKMTRTYIYLPLQVMKYGFPAVLFSLPAAGGALIFAQMMRRWMPYVVYRYAGREVEDFPARFVRLSIFIVIWALLLPTEWNWAFILHGIAIFLWLSLRGFTQLRMLVLGAHHIAEDQWKKK